MIGIKEGDYVTNSEGGGGKVLQVSDSTILIDFIRDGEKYIPIIRTQYYKKVATNGFIASLYLSIDDVKKLIEQRSTEIIKLLILDEDKTGRSIKTIKIKSLLIIDEKSSEAGKKKIGLIDQADWKKWWTAVSKKIKSDPWFDTSSNGIISLRESPVALFSSIIEKFDSEKDPGRKMTLCKQLLNDQTAVSDALVAEKLAAYVDELLNAPQQKDILGQSVMLALELEQKAGGFSSFAENGKVFSVRALLFGELPFSAQSKLYSYLCKLHEQDVYDHLLIFCFSDEKLREIVHRRLTEKKFQTVLKQRVDRINLTDEQVDFVNNFSDVKKFDEGLRSLLIFFKMGSADDGVLTSAKRTVQNFLANMLIDKNILPNVKELIAKIVVEEKLKGVVYPFMNLVRSEKDADSDFFRDLLLLVGPQSIERTLLTNETALKRPPIFISAVSVLVSDETISDQIMLDIMAKVTDVLSALETDGIDIQGLRIAIAKAVGGRDSLNIGLSTLDSISLKKLVTNRLGKLQDRAGAIDILVGNREKETCLSFIPVLTDKVEVDDLILLRKLIDAYPEDAVSDEILAGILNQLTEIDPILEENFCNIFGGPPVVKRLAVFIAGRDAEWHNQHKELVKRIISHIATGRELTEVWIADYVFSSKLREDVRLALGEYLMCDPLSTLRAVREAHLKYADKMRVEIEELRDLHQHEIESIVTVKSKQVDDAIERVAQRYEEHLKSFIDVSSDLSDIRNELVSSDNKVSHDLTVEDLGYKLIVVKQKIDHVLRVLNIIDRE